LSIDCNYGCFYVSFFVCVYVCVWVQQRSCNLASLPRKDTKDIVKELDLLIWKVGFLCAICPIVFLCIAAKRKMRRRKGLVLRQQARAVADELVCVCVCIASKGKEQSLMKSCVCVCVFVRVELVWHMYTNESVRTCAS